MIFILFSIVKKENNFQKKQKIVNDFDERGVSSYVDNDSDWWYKRQTCAGMNHYLITQRISRDEAFDERIGCKKKSAHCCTATANRVSPRCSRRRLSTTDDNKSLPGAFPSHDVLRDARHAGWARIINYFLPDEYKRARHAHIRAYYPRTLRVEKSMNAIEWFRSQNESDRRATKEEEDRSRQWSETWNKLNTATVRN